MLLVKKNCLYEKIILYYLTWATNVLSDGPLYFVEDCQNFHTPLFVEVTTKIQILCRYVIL